MEDVNAIHRIFKNLKYEMDNNGWVYQWHLGDEPIKVTHKFYPPVSSEEFQLFEKYFPPYDSCKRNYITFASLKKKDS